MSHIGYPFIPALVFCGCVWCVCMVIHDNRDNYTLCEEITCPLPASHRCVLSLRQTPNNSVPVVCSNLPLFPTCVRQTGSWAVRMYEEGWHPCVKGGLLGVYAFGDGLGSPSMHRCPVSCLMTSSPSPMTLLVINTTFFLSMITVSKHTKDLSSPLCFSSRGRCCHYSRLGCFHSPLCTEKFLLLLPKMGAPRDRRVIYYSILTSPSKATVLCCYDCHDANGRFFRG